MIYVPPCHFTLSFRSIELFIGSTNSIILVITVRSLFTSNTLLITKHVNVQGPSTHATLSYYHYFYLNHANSLTHTLQTIKGWEKLT